MTSLFDLSGRTALVTGSTRGLGRAMAFSLAEAGARVVLNYANDKERGLACQRSFEEAGHESLLVGASVIDEGNVDRLVSKVESEFGGVDILVVNATPMQPRNPIESYDWAFHQEMIDYFLKSPFLLARRILPRMKAQKWGRMAVSRPMTGGGHCMSASVSPRRAGNHGENVWRWPTFH